VRVHKDVPGVRGRYAREEIVAIADHHAWFVEGELGVKENLGDLGHAGDGFYGEVTEAVYGPGVLESGDGTQTVGGVGEEVEEELGVCFYRVDTAFEEESGKSIFLSLGTEVDLLGKIRTCRSHCTYDLCRQGLRSLSNHLL